MKIYKLYFRFFEDYTCVIYLWNYRWLQIDGLVQFLLFVDFLEELVELLCPLQGIAGLLSNLSRGCQFRFEFPETLLKIVHSNSSNLKTVQFWNGTINNNKMRWCLVCLSTLSSYVSACFSSVVFYYIFQH